MWQEWQRFELLGGDALLQHIRRRHESERVAGEDARQRHRALARRELSTVGVSGGPPPRDELEEYADMDVLTRVLLELREMEEIMEEGVSIAEGVSGAGRLGVGGMSELGKVISR